MFYANNDDNLMNAILNGSYLGHTDSHAFFVNAPVSNVLQLLYSIVGWIPWYPLMLFSAVCLPLGIFLFKEKGKLDRLELFALFLPVFLPALFGFTFTTASAMLVIVGLGVFLLRKDEVLFPALCMAFSYCLRSEMFVAGCAFLLVAVVHRLLEREWKGVCKTIGCMVALVVLFAGLNSLMYRSPQWQQYQEVNEKRVSIYDYTWFIPYEKAPELYEKYDVSYEQYLLVDNYAMAMEATDWSELLSKVDQIQIDYDGDYSLEGRLKQDPMLTLRVGFYRVRHTFADLFWPFGALVLVLYAGLGIAILCSKKWLAVIPTACLLMGRTLIWMYLLLRGRFPDRVYLSVCGMECMLLAGILWKLLPLVKWKKWGAMALAVACALCGLWQGATMTLQQVEHAKEEEAYETLYRYMEANEDNTYLLDVRTMLSDTGKVFDFDTKQDNYFQLGGWISASPVLQERMEQVARAEGISSQSGQPATNDEGAGGDGRTDTDHKMAENTEDKPVDAGDLLRYGSRVYFVVDETRGVDWMSTYMAGRFPGTEMEVVERLSAEDKVFFICKIKNN